MKIFIIFVHIFCIFHSYNEIFFQEIQIGDAHQAEVEEGLNPYTPDEKSKNKYTLKSHFLLYYCNASV